MLQKENLQEFVTRQCSIELPTDHNSKEGAYFTAGYRDYNIAKNYTPSMIRNFYKIGLIIGEGQVYYGNKGMHIDQPALMFSHPNLPYSWECLSEKQAGFYCLFNEEFLSLSNNKVLSASPLKLGGHYVFFLDQEKENFASFIFQKMIEEDQANYQYRNEMLLSYVSLLVHEALKMTPADSYFTPSDSSSRIAMFFTELLERQFPVDPYNKKIRLKTPQDYAEQLSVHVNHLNRSVKNVTGKTTSSIIADRLIAEAKVLLVHSGWNVTEVASGLGFDDPSYFARLFKLHTGIAPTSFKQNV